MPNFLGPYNSKAAPEDKKLEHLLPLGPLWGSPHCLSFCYSGPKVMIRAQSRVPVEQLTSGSCNDRSVMLCECRSQGGGLRRGGAAETRLLRLLQCGWRWHSWQEGWIDKHT